MLAESWSTACLLVTWSSKSAMLAEYAPLAVDSRGAVFRVAVGAGRLRAWPPREAMIAYALGSRKCGKELPWEPWGEDPGRPP